MPIPVDELNKKEQDYEEDLEGWIEKIVNFLKENKGKAFTFDEIIEETGAPLKLSRFKILSRSEVGYALTEKGIYCYYKGDE